MKWKIDGTSPKKSASKEFGAFVDTHHKSINIISNGELRQVSMGVKMVKYFN